MGSSFFQEAAAAGVKFLCFPEVFSFIGSKDGESVKIAEPLDGPIMQRYCSLAKSVRTYLLIFSVRTYLLIFFLLPFHSSAFSFVLTELFDFPIYFSY